ncbi:hypothetical protein A4A49_40152 [Nicotiana attenuata]|uniref:Retrovirus-related Pol polyprotein from transposon TNT 1-94-like beta-barrel domain-containing protein n=1 Tax=Nicotiana attenuata TaxID=49451 RepID=A0A1J6KEZ4_NICAT|nr:hypothetical protein A4A49_40152 [Nicotiana attenuata]
MDDCFPTQTTVPDYSSSVSTTDAQESYPTIATDVPITPTDNDLVTGDVTIPVAEILDTDSTTPNTEEVEGEHEMQDISAELLPTNVPEIAIAPHTSRMEPVKDQGPRKTTRTSKPPVWLKDYQTTKKFTGCCLYLLSNTLTYANISTGYPEDFRRRKAFHPKGILTTANHVEGFVNHEEGNMAQSSQGISGASQARGGDHFFTEAQYQQILDLLRDSPPSDMKAQNQATTAGIITSLSSSVHISNKRNDDWIVDSGATHHISSTLDLMNDVRRVDDRTQDKVTLTNGVTTKIEHVGSSYLSDFDKLENVLHVPDFKFNLMLVSKLTRDLKCAATFLPTLCVFQDLYNGRVKAIGKENEGLYILKGRGIRLLAANMDGQPGGLLAISNLEQSFQVPPAAETGTSSPVEDGNNGVNTASSPAEDLEESSVPNENHDAAPLVLENVEDISVGSLVQDGVTKDIQNGQDTPRTESVSNAPTRQSLRVKNPPIWQRDYVLQS